MFNKFYNFCNNFIRRRKIPVLAVIGLAVLLSVINLPGIKYDNDIEMMLPADQEIIRGMRFLREAGLSDKVIISLKLTNPHNTTEELIYAVDKLAGSLNGPLVTSVTSGLSAGSLQEEIQSFLKFSPQIIPANDLNKIEEQLTLKGVNNALRLSYNRLLSPGGEFLAPFIRRDPLGIENKVLRRLNNLSSAEGYSIKIENNHFVSKDGRHSLLIVDTPVSLTEGFGCRRLIDHLNERIKNLPGYVEAKIISGHTHTISNEEVIKKDIWRTSSIATIAFFVIFLIAFKDIRAMIFFLIPLAAVIIAINLASFVFPALSYFVVGMGAVIVGIADDYGIHVYTAVHTSKKRETVGLIAKPLLIAALTTTSVFTAFFFSKVQGYHQLAFFAATSIFLCLGFVLFILPHFLKEGGCANLPAPDEHAPSVKSDRFRVAVWFIILAVLISFSARLHFNNDIVQFDGSKKEIFAAEEEFKRAWGIKEYPAMLVNHGQSEEEAFHAAESIAGIVNDDNFVTFVSLWPSAKTRKDNASNWEKFWKQGREVKLKSLISQVGLKYDFTEDAFKPFFDGLYSGLDAKIGPENLNFFTRLKERFVIEKPGDYRVISFFPDSNRFLAKVSAAAKDHPGTFVVSRKSLSKSVSASIAKEVLFLSVIAATIILILTFLLLKDLKLMLISLVSVFSAIIAVTGTFSILNRPMNSAALVASMVVVGLCIDYGVFMLYSYRHATQIGTVKAVWVSAATTIIGAVSLLFAGHPVLFSIGLVLTAGLFAGFLSSQFILPALYRACVQKEARV